MKIYRSVAKSILSAVIAGTLMVTSLVSISAYTYDTKDNNYTYLDVTDYNYTKETYLELNQINEGLRQKINDTVQNNVRCTVTFKVTYSDFSNDLFTPINRCALLGNEGYFKQVVDITGSYITFNWDEFIPNHNMWGLMRELTLYSNTSFTIKEVIIYVPKQPVLVDLSAGAPCVLYSESLSE